MYEITSMVYTPENFMAGDFPMKTDIGTVKSGAAVRRHAPIVLGEDGIEELTAATLDRLIGIAAAEPVDDEVVFYLTGEFFAHAIVMPDGVTVETLKPALRKLGIFLREAKRNA